MPHPHRWLLLLPFLSFAFSARHAPNGPVIATGAMRNTMFNGQLDGLISLDSLATPGNYGVGPLEHLQGELLLLDGRTFVSTTSSDSTMTIEVRNNVRAPFFVHQRVKDLTMLELPLEVTDLHQLDGYLTRSFGALGVPFSFQLVGLFAYIKVHVLDLPGNTHVQAPADVHRHNKYFTIEERKATAVGFFSTSHHTIFTHHDSNIHVHAITMEEDWMGHVEEMRFDPRQVQLMVAFGGE